MLLGLNYKKLPKTPTLGSRNQMISPEKVNVYSLWLNFFESNYLLLS